MSTIAVTPPHLDTADEEQREELVRGLVAFASFLLDHPEAPVHPHGTTVTFDPGSPASVRELAAELGIKAEEKHRGTLATVTFGPVRYALYSPSVVGA